jgi:hypothetical protein
MDTAHATAAFPPLLSATEGASAYLSSAEMEIEVDARLHLLLDRKRLKLYDRAIEGDAHRFSHDAGPLTCHCSGGISCGYPSKGAGKEGNNWCQRTVRSVSHNNTLTVLWI